MGILEPVVQAPKLAYRAPPIGGAWLKESIPLTHAERARLGAAKRWGNPANRRVVRLDSLTPEQRRLVLALVAAAKSTPSGEAA